MYFSILFLMIVFLLMLKNVNIRSICTCKVVVFSFFQPNCNKVFCFYTPTRPFVLLAGKGQRSGMYSVLLHPCRGGKFTSGSTAVGVVSGGGGASATRPRPLLRRGRSLVSATRGRCGVGLALTAVDPPLKF